MGKWVIEKDIWLTMSYSRSDGKSLSFWLMSILVDLDDKIDSVEHMENAIALLNENFSNSIDRQTEERRKFKDLLEQNETKTK